MAYRRLNISISKSKTGKMRQILLWLSIMKKLPLPKILPATIITLPSLAGRTTVGSVGVRKAEERHLRVNSPVAQCKTSRVA